MFQKVFSTAPRPMWGGLSALVFILIAKAMDWSILDALNLPLWPTFIAIIIITGLLMLISTSKNSIKR